MDAEIYVVEDVTSAALELVTTTLRAAVKARGRGILCLSGGSTPVPLYQRLAQRPDLPWAQTVLTWGDERYVEHDHPDSNYGAARRLFVDQVDIRPANVLPWPEGPTPEQAAAEYGRSLVEGLGPDASFDLNIVGLGPDGHTASLFPGTGAALRGDDTFALNAPGFGWRLTMGAARLSHSAVTLFMVSGEQKRRALQDTFGPASRGPSSHSSAALDAYPGRAIGASERLILVTDVAFLD